MSLFETRDRTLWVGTWGGGLCRYNATYENFERIDLPSPADDYIQCLFEDDQNNLWYGTTTGGLHKFNPNTKKIIYYSKKTEGKKYFPADNITFITQDNKGNFWIGTWNDGLIQFDSKTEKAEQFLYNPSSANSISSNGVWHILNDNNEHLLLSTFAGVDLFELKTHKIIRQPNFSNSQRQLLNAQIRQILKDYYGNLWIGTFNYGGLFYYDRGSSTNNKEQNALVPLTNEADNPNSISSNSIRWLYEDRNKNIWVGTEDGLNKLPATKPFVQYRRFPLRETSLGGHVINSICAGQKNNLWVGYGGAGFDKIELNTNKISHFNTYNNLSNRNLSNYDVVTIYEDRNGIVWIGTKSGGLNKYNPKTGEFKHFVHSPENSNSIISNWVQQILETRDGQFLIGTNDGLQLFDRDNEIFTDFNPIAISDSIKLKSTVSVNALFEDSDNNLWIGTWLDGLFRYIPDEQKLFQYYPDAKNPFSLSSSKVTNIYEDSKGFIWICTHSGGLNKFDKQNRKFYHYSTHNGLPNDVVFGVLEDSNGNLWISTLNGLARYNPSSNVFRIYTVIDGLVHNQFNWRACTKSKNGEMYFGGINGFVSFYPDSISKDENPPPVAFTSFRVFDQETALPKALASTKEIYLNYDQNFISIEFAALDLAPVKKHNFAYMLKGIDPTWVHSGNRSIAYYTDIQHGEYTFYVKASNADNVWSEPISLSIIVSPAWWNTWWFRILAISALAALGIFIYKYRVNQVLKIERIRYNIASDLHDEIGSNLSSISVDGQMLLRSNSLNKNERELSTDISKTAVETIDAMRDIIWFINPKNDTGDDVILKMKETASRLLLGIDWTFNYSTGIRFELFSLELRRHIFLIYKEILTNIMRHSNSSKVVIELSKQSFQLILTVTDNGNGFDTNAITRNYGLLSMQKRAENIKANLDIKSEIGIGTTVTLKVNAKHKWTKKATRTVS
jgi:ligand-binding sensor domain-containing protein